MAKIKVDPELLLIKSGQILTESAAVGKVSSRLSTIARSAPSYDGQFGPVVRSIANDAVSRGKDVFKRIDLLSTQLTNKARDFLMADSAFKTIYNKYRNSKITDSMYNSLMSNKTYLELMKICIFGSLSDNKSYQTWVLLLYMYYLYTLPVKIKPKTKKIVPSSPPLKKEKPKKYVYTGIAEKVKKGKANTSEFGYPRNGYGGVQSNCTWYAAQAVNQASNGDVSISGLGNATDWVNNAINNGYKVDGNLEAGSIVHFDFGHVGYIEKVETVGGKTMVTWSEEQATGKPPPGWSNVKQINGQLRWRVTADLSGYIKKGTAKCIHVKYP